MNQRGTQHEWSTYLSKNTIKNKSFIQTDALSKKSLKLDNQDTQKHYNRQRYIRFKLILKNQVGVKIDAIKMLNNEKLKFKTTIT